jgi:hypothetical protein
MVKPPIKKATIKATKLRDPSIAFYMVAIRDTIKRGDKAAMKTLLSSAEGVQKAGGLDKLIVDLRGAIERAK